MPIQIDGRGGYDSFALTSRPTGAMLLTRRQPFFPSAAHDKFFSICTAFSGYTEFGIAPESVIFSLLEKKTRTYLAFRISGKTSAAVLGLMNTLHNVYGERFSQVFKTITVDNGSEFADFAQIEKWGTKVFFAHPYTAWERPQNERHNGLFRAFVPKEVSIDAYTDEDILAAADELNGRPRRKLGYRTPEELFDAFLDRVFAA